MRSPLLAFSALLLATLPVFAAEATLRSPLVLAGPTAVFSSATLNSILDDRDCTGVRFYNVLLDGSQTGATIMAVGYQADGSDLNGGLFAQPYKASSPIDRDPANVTELSRSAATDACGNVAASGAASYSTTLSKADLQALLALPGCGGVRVVVAEGTTDRLQVVAVSIADGVATDLGRGGDYERSCGDPCPMLCGPPANYINAAHMQLK